jgi:hypothetical protein
VAGREIRERPQHHLLAVLQQPLHGEEKRVDPVLTGELGQPSLSESHAGDLRPQIAAQEVRETTVDAQEDT